MCSMVPVPDEADEDARRRVRERSQLIAGRVRVTNRIGAVLATLGVSNYSPLLRNRARRLHRYSLERVLRPSATIRRRRADTTCTAATPCTISSGSDLSMFGRLHRRTRLCAWQPGNVALIRARTGGMRSPVLSSFHLAYGPDQICSQVGQALRHRCCLVFAPRCPG